jgi:hypothetical protein
MRSSRNGWNAFFVSSAPGVKPFSVRKLDAGRQQKFQVAAQEVPSSGYAKTGCAFVAMDAPEDTGFEL